MSMNVIKQRGFTLVQLIMVIVIMGGRRRSDLRP
jgi:hypothetical protein